jgi:hypothetical protein
MGTIVCAKWAGQPGRPASAGYHGAMSAPSERLARTSHGEGQARATSMATGTGLVTMSRTGE